MPVDADLKGDLSAKRGAPHGGRRVPNKVEAREF